jgi:hypothetical protein
MALGASDRILSAPHFAMALRTREDFFYGSQVILHRKKGSTSRSLFQVPEGPDPWRRF